MISLRRGILKLLESTSDETTDTSLRLACETLSLPRLEVGEPVRLKKAAQHWKLFKLGLTGEVLPLLVELSSLSSLDYLVSFALDLSSNPPSKVWRASHPERVAAIAKLIATDGVEYAIGKKLLRWSNRPTELGVEGIVVAGLIHDFGKLLLPNSSFWKQSSRADVEHPFEREHPEIGYEALKPINWPWPEVLQVVLSHHENIKGTGYPQGLQEDEIPWPAQIVGLANFCDHLLRPQNYQRIFSPHELAKFIGKEGSLLYHPALIQALLQVWDKIVYSLDSPEPV